MTHTDPIAVVLIALVGMICGAIGMLFFANVIAHIHSLLKRVSDLETTVTQQNKKLEELEQTLARQRHTENTVSALEDAGLIGVAEIYRAQAAIDQNNLILDHIKSQLIKQTEILSVVREGPRAYPVDPASGERPKNGNKKK